MIDDSDRLKPCPFCGGSAASFAHDDDCYFKVLEKIKQAPKGDVSAMAELIPAWNRRHEAQQPAQAAADARDALLTESARWEKSDHRLAVWEALRVLGSRMGVMVTREDQYAALATHQQRQDSGEGK